MADNEGCKTCMRPTAWLLSLRGFPLECQGGFRSGCMLASHLNSKDKLTRLVQDDWRDVMIADLREIGVVGEVCLGCGKVDCGGCPAGSSTSIIHAALSPEASEKLRQLWARRRETTEEG